MPAFTVTRAETRWTVTFGNPPANLVDPEMILELQTLVDVLERDPDVIVLVFRSDDADHFLGPYGIARTAETPSEPGPTGMPRWLDLTVRLSRLPVVSIAVMRGAGRGVGQEFALACDLRFDSLEHTAIDQPEVSKRLVPGGGAISRLPALVGRARALELILGSVVLDGGMADGYGVVNRALPDAELDDFVEKRRRARRLRPSRARRGQGACRPRHPAGRDGPRERLSSVLRVSCSADTNLRGRHMRADIVPGGTLPDYELPDHTSVPRKLSELQGDDPMIVTLARGHYCPKEHQKHLELAAFYPKIAVA